MQDPLIIQIQPIRKDYDPELFHLENIKENGQLITGSRLGFHTVIHIIEDKMPEQIKLKCYDLWSGTVAKFVHEIYIRFYYLKETSKYNDENSRGNDDHIEFLFIKPPFADRNIEELKKSREF
jgi:hypothetical protein